MNYNMVMVSGKIGSGKDTIADYLIKLNKKDRWYGLKFWSKVPKFEKVSFADRLKYASSMITGNSIFDMYSQEGKNKKCLNQTLDMNTGYFLQDFGTNTMRNTYGNTIWVNSTQLPKLNKFKLFGYEFIYYNKSNKNTIKLLPDCRFKNEAQFGKENGAYMIRVNGDPCDVRKNSTRDLTHISETDLDDYTDWDIVIPNNSTLQDLHSRIKIMYHFLIKSKY